ncbi:MAG: hypothetical protein U0997_06570 [Sulfurimicrobium sp.]|nr:hypothetical protein [Sulfurimicrobium sp.]
MARQARQTENIGQIVTDADTPQLQQMVETHDQFTQQLAVIDKQFGGGEYEITIYNRDRVINECKFFLGQSAQAMLEAGKRLILMKEHEAHGDWISCLNQLNVEPRIAQMMMKAAIKFSNPNAKSISHLGSTKLFDLMILDDDEIQALGDGGTVAGLTLDEIDKMTTRELRVALREAKENETAKDRLLADKNSKIDDLATKLETRQQKIKPADPDEEGAQLRDEVGRFGYAAEVAIRGDLFRGFTALAEHADKHDCTHEEFMSGCLAQIERALLELRNRFYVKDEPDGQEKPDWVRQLEAEDAALLADLPSVSEVIGED